MLPLHYTELSDLFKDVSKLRALPPQHIIGNRKLRIYLPLRDDKNKRNNNSRVKRMKTTQKYEKVKVNEESDVLDIILVNSKSKRHHSLLSSLKQYP